MNKYIIIAFAALTSSLVEASSLSIIPKKNNLIFPGFYISGIYQNATSHPKYDQPDVTSFYVSGLKNRDIVISIPENQSITNNSNVVELDNYLFGCGLSATGKATIKNDGMSELLCIGIKTRILPKHDSGIYSGNVTFKVNYL